MDAAARLHLARLGRKHRGARITFLDDLGEPKDDGRYISLPCYLDGRLATVIVLTTENFYDALHKVAGTLMPAIVKDRPH